MYIYERVLAGFHRMFDPSDHGKQCDKFAPVNTESALALADIFDNKKKYCD